MDAEEIEKEWTQEEREVLIQKGLVFTQLLDSIKFKQFLELNYDFVREEESRMMYVVEVPDEVAMKRAAEAMKAAQPDLVTATPADLKRLTKK